MKLEIISLRDSAAEAYMTPQFYQSVAQAVRSFMDAVNDGREDNGFAKHPEDYVLFHLGSFDPETGVIVVFPAPVSLGVGINFVKPSRDVRQLELMGGER